MDNEEHYFTVEEMRERIAELEAIERQLCPACSGIGIVPCEWLYQREPKCTCDAATDDFLYTLHAVNCDSVPCPFCPED